MARVLIVEDDRSIRELLNELLTGEGMRTLLADNGRDGVALATDEHPDLILMDLMLPTLDGATATRMLKSDPRTRQIRIVVMSASGTLLRLAANLPADGLIRKPFDLDELLETVRAQVGRALMNGHDGAMA